MAEYPDRDISMIIPFGPGGGSDVLARTIANVISEMKAGSGEDPARE